MLRARAESGDSSAQHKLGIAYAEGRQAPVDPIEAVVWLTLAAESGTNGKELGALLLSLSDEQVEAAARRLGSTRASNPNLRSPSVAAASQSTLGITKEPSAVHLPGRETQAAQKNKSPELAASRADAATARSGVATEQSQPAAARVTQGSNSAAAALERERMAHAASQAEIAQLKAWLNELIADRAVLERDAGARVATTVRGESSFVAEAKKWAAEQKGVSGNNETTTNAAAEEASSLQRERNAHFVTQAALEKLRTQLTELTSSRATMEREFNARIATAERRQHDAAAEVSKRAAEKAALSEEVSSLAAELRDARTELATVRENSAATSAKAVSSESQASEIDTLKNRLSSSRAFSSTRRFRSLAFLNRRPLRS